jgi:hypothetical protein
MQNLIYVCRTHDDSDHQLVLPPEPTCARAEHLSINDYPMLCHPLRWAAVEAAMVTLREAGFTGLVSLDLDEEHE